MPKKLSDVQKSEILEAFKNGSETTQIAKNYNYSNVTIIRQLKIMLGNDLYLKFKERKSLNNSDVNKNHEDSLSNDEMGNLFYEFEPLIEGVELNIQKDFSSLPIVDFKFPNVAYMVIDKGIDLEIKFLKEFPEWQFLPKDDLNRKIIQIYFDIKNAKRDCNKEQKVIKVPNTNVFKIVSPILLSRGITRIICEDKLLAL